MRAAPCDSGQAPNSGTARTQAAREAASPAIPRGGARPLIINVVPRHASRLFRHNRSHVLIGMKVDDYDEADRREVDPPIEVDSATWSAAGTLDWWVKERQQWLGRVRGRDGRQRWIKAVDLRQAKEGGKRGRSSSVNVGRLFTGSRNRLSAWIIEPPHSRTHRPESMSSPWHLVQRCR